MTGHEAAHRVEARGDQSLSVPVRELLARPGTQTTIGRCAELGPLSVAGVTVAGPVDIEVTLDAISEGVVVSGHVGADWVGECRRCLRAVEGRLRAPVRELFLPSAGRGAGDGAVDGDEDSYPITDGHLDLEPLARETVLCDLPLAPLCDSACRGPAPDAFPTDESAADGRDPRWAALDELDLES